MRLHEINPGEKRKLQKSKFESVWDKLIVPNCSEILSMYKLSNSLLYRGLKHDFGLIFRGSSRTNRRPLDSYLTLSELFEVGLKSIGMTALRSNSIFASNKPSIAGAFGDYVYIIFPIDGFEYTWFSDADITLGNQYPFLKGWANSDIIDTITQAWESEEYLRDYYAPNFMRDPSVVDLTKNLSSNINNINKLLGRHNIPPIQPIDLIDVEKFKIYYNPQKTGLLDMMKNSKYSPKETMITGSYYAFDNCYEKQITDKLFENKVSLN